MTNQTTNPSPIRDRLVQRLDVWIERRITSKIAKADSLTTKESSKQEGEASTQ